MILKQVTKNTFKLFIYIGSFFLLIIVLGFTFILMQIPSDKEIKGCITTKMYEVKLCPDNGQYVKIGQISEFLQKSVVLTEDSAFYQHSGFDFTELERSFKTNLEKGKFARGGSTITQQLAKNLFLTKDKTLTRKLIEALITIRIEKVLSKKQILEKYLNVVQFGKNIFGVKQAALYYFKKTPGQLNMTESAFLTFLLPSPETYSKSFHLKQLTPFAKKRLYTIVERMYAFQRIGTEDYEQSIQQIPYFLSGPPPADADKYKNIDEEDGGLLDYFFGGSNDEETKPEVKAKGRNAAPTPPSHEAINGLPHTVPVTSPPHVGEPEEVEE